MSNLIKMLSHRKGDASDYRPTAGTRCLISGPHCDDENGYTYGEFEVLWSDALFVLYRKEGCWPVINKWEHIIAKPLPDAPAAPSAAPSAANGAEMPELPEPQCYPPNGREPENFSDKQMQAYARAAVLVEREACAKECTTNDHETAYGCAGLIRART